jgi:hypothetical protein
LTAGISNFIKGLGLELAWWTNLKKPYKELEKILVMHDESLGKNWKEPRKVLESL